MKNLFLSLYIYIYRHRVERMLVRGNYLINVEFYGLNDLPPKSANFRAIQKATAAAMWRV